MSRAAYRTDALDRINAHMARREELAALARRQGRRVTVAPSDPHAPVTDVHTRYEEEGSCRHEW